jgi:tripartite-type tricarboxylate transporter receptor subunit TctC
MNLAAAAGSVLPAGAFAQAYPNQQVEIIVPFPAAGGPLDTVAHLFSTEIQQAGGPGGVVENRVGAGGFVGALSVLRAPPDG